MNLEKADIKIAAAHELGCRLDDTLDAAEKDQYRLEGAAASLQKAASAVSALNKVVDEECDAGKFDLEHAVIIKRFVERAHQMVLNLAIQHDNARASQVGRVAGLRTAVEVTKKFRDDEALKVTQIREAISRKQVTPEGEPVEGAEGDRVIGIRPGKTLKERRLAEEQAAKEAEGTAAPPEAEPAAPEPDVVQEPVKKKRRPRKAE